MIMKEVIFFIVLLLLSSDCIRIDSDWFAMVKYDIDSI